MTMKTERWINDERFVNDRWTNGERTLNARWTNGERTVNERKNGKVERFRDCTYENRQLHSGLLQK